MVREAGLAVTLHTASTLPGVRAFSRKSLTWIDTNREGIRIQPVRATREAGQFFGFLAFDTMVNTGIHQHTGPAFSFFLHGGLADYQGIATAGQMGINLAGATHDAIAVAPTLMMSRLDAPVIYSNDTATAGETVHTGAFAGLIVNGSPETLPDVNVTVDELAWHGTKTAGIQRRNIFDYAGTGLTRRSLQLRMLPGSSIGPFRAIDIIDIYVLGGDLSAGRERAEGGDFVVIDPDAEVTLTTRYGCLLFIWMDGPAHALLDDAQVIAPFGKP
jgi:hypothetical protein